MECGLKFILGLLEKLGRSAESGFIELGKFWLFLFAAGKWCFKKPFRISLITEQFEKNGVNSVQIITVSSLAVGMIFSLQSTFMMRLFNAESYVGATVAIILGRELAPVMTALMLIAKNGSAMTAEIGTMKVTEQIDAMETMAVNPIHYLVVPRIFASILAYPLLSGIANIVGVMGAYFVAVVLQGVDGASFLDVMYFFMDPEDIYAGLIKASVMGFIVTVICCYFGFATKNGAKGVGEATTQAVVTASISILIADYVMGAIMIPIFFLPKT